MKDYFLNLFNYDEYANKKLLEATRQAGNPEKAIQLMGHLLAAQQRWLSRCTTEVAIDNNLFPQIETTPFEELIDQKHQEWTSFLSGLQDSDMGRVITYKNTAGTAFSNTLTEVLTQVINHGTHHRAQIGQQLKLAGLAVLPTIDFIFFVRN